MNYWELDAERVIRSIKPNVFAGKKVLITGASGLLGTSLINVFAMLDADFRPNLYGTTFSSSNSILEEAKKNGVIDLIKCDLTRSDVYRSLDHIKFDIIIHAAGYGQPGKFLGNKLNTIRINTYSTDKLFELMAPEGKFVYLSTSELYSGNAEMPYTETQIGATNTNHPRSSYIESKRCGEAICEAYRDCGYSTISARLALAYGPGTHCGDRRVLNNFIEKALKSKKIELLDFGSAMRTYGYVSDIVEIILKMAISEKNGIYNLGGESRVSIGELAELIGSIMDVPVIFPNNSAGLNDAPTDVLLDLEKVKSDFSKHEFLSLKDGLANTIDWQRSIYETTV